MALILYLLVFSDDNTDDVDDVNVDETEQVIVEDTLAREEQVDTNKIAEYNRYISDPNMDINQEYSSAALNKLVAATRILANDLNLDVSSHLSAAESTISLIAAPLKMMEFTSS